MRHDAPHQVGPDRIVNSVAAKERYGVPCIVVDFGTSTNFDVVSPQGEYVGGVLAPGIEISMEALFARAARLTKVDLAEPPSAIGKTTEQALQSGSRVRLRRPGRPDRRGDQRERELGAEARRRVRRDRGAVADLVAAARSRTIEIVDPLADAGGLRLVVGAEPLAAAVDRDREVQEDRFALRQLVFETLEDEARARVRRRRGAARPRRASRAGRAPA